MYMIKHDLLIHEVQVSFWCGMVSLWSVLSSGHSTSFGLTTLIAFLRIWQYGLWSFQTGGTKLEIFLFKKKNQRTQRKLLNFDFLINGKLSKSAKI